MRKRKRSTIDKLITKFQKLAAKLQKKAKKARRR